MLLEPELRARLERLVLADRRRVRGSWTGRHRSARLGESLDFADYREYNPGDDFRRIDYNLWARLGTVLIRLFEAEDEQPIRILVDTSASMDFGAKFTTARKLSGAIAFMALAAGERVRLLTVPAADRPTVQGPWARHVSSWPRLEAWLEALEPGGGTDLPGAARLVAASQTLRGPIILVSDLMAPGWEQAIDVLGVIGGGVVLHVLDPAEMDPDLIGDLTLRDRETGREVPVSLTDAALDRYRQRVEQFLSDAAARARRSDMAHVVVPAGEGAVDDAIRNLVAGGVMR